MSDDRLGVPYQGSKNKIAKQIVSFLPPAPVFVDAFCGGCAITHGAMLSRKFGRIVCNDLDDTAQTLFKNAINGVYHDETRWVSRDDFMALKDSDPYVSICWSFGNNRFQYMYAEGIEPWKKAIHYARVLKDCSLLREMGIDGDGSRKDVLRHKDEYKAKYIQWWLKRQQYSIDDLDELKSRCKNQISVLEEDLRQYLQKGLQSSGMTQAEVGLSDLWESLESLEGLQKLESLQRIQKLESLQSLESLHRLQSLESLERIQSLESLQKLESHQRLQCLQSLESLERLQSLESLQSLEMLQRVTFTSMSYDKLEIPELAVVYCDPPYKGTSCAGYVGGFDHSKFYDWIEETARRCLVFISEYDMPSDRFECVLEIKKQNLYCSTANKKGVERLFIPKGQRRTHAVQLTLF